MKTILIPIHSVKINSSGERCIVMPSGQRIPCSIAALAVGKDGWMARVTVKCQECQSATEIRHMTGEGQWCTECAGAECE